ncbi:hypothetical protein [Streptomyces sp. B22F1]|uniref:hypothetical protein n=1 Tax=Streptomyces sp. B22F1 TaxID=3153566 RepID=UPI00325E5A80
MTSGFGHLLGTGLLEPDESALLAERLAGSDLDSGFGLRTLSSDSGGYNPFGHHIGSVCRTTRPPPSTAWSAPASRSPRPPWPPACSTHPGTSAPGCRNCSPATAPTPAAVRPRTRRPAARRRG